VRWGISQEVTTTTAASSIIPKIKAMVLATRFLNNDFSLLFALTPPLWSAIIVPPMFANAGY